MNQGSLKRFTCDFATSDDISGGVFNGGVSGFDGELWLGFVASTLFGFIFFCSDPERWRPDIRFQLPRAWRRKDWFSWLCCSSIVGGTGIRQERTRIVVDQSAKTIDHQGHEGTRRKLLNNKTFVMLRVLGDSLPWGGEPWTSVTTQRW